MKSRRQIEFVCADKELGEGCQEGSPDKLEIGVSLGTLHRDSRCGSSPELVDGVAGSNFNQDNSSVDYGDF